jgi:putative ABC transport system permease protein
MVLLVLRKIAANRWMVASLLVGVILAVAMVTAIPIYSRGILTRLLIRDLQIYQETSGTYPGLVTISGVLPLDPESREKFQAYPEFAAEIESQVEQSLPVPIRNRLRRIELGIVRARRIDQPENRLVAAPLTSVSGLFDRVTVALGRLPAEAGADGDSNVIEAVITEQTAASGRFTYGQTYELLPVGESLPIDLRLRVVGVIAMADPSDDYWTLSRDDYWDSLLAWQDDVVAAANSIVPLWNLQVGWGYSIDYQQLSSEQVAPLAQVVHDQIVAGRRMDLTVRVPAIHILDNYVVRERTLKITLWVLQAPLLLMLGFYLFMVAQILIDHERNEIALMKSRGADPSQVFLIYVLLGALLALAGAIAGPLLGMALCRVLGASSGFLEFVRRHPLRLEFTPQTYYYAAAASVLALVTMLVPAMSASRTTIVHHKHQQARSRRKPIWKTFFLDLVALAVAGYGLYQYRNRAQAVELSGLQGADLAIDPILLCISTFFVIGAGLLFLRFYPLLVRWVFRLGRRRWRPAAFASLVHVGRGGGKDQFLMLFIILSISIGVFNADTARTLNDNTEEQVRYAAGADVVIQERWFQRLTSSSSGEPSGGPPDSEEPTGPYIEPSFRRFQDLPGVLRATRVFRTDDARVRSFGGDSFRYVTLMGIVPHEFGPIAWLRNDLTPVHWYNYLNLLAQSPAAALLSRSLEEQGVELGDVIYIQWGDQPLALFYVYGFVDFWPAFNPYQRISGNRCQSLAVVNLSYLQAMTAIEPYQVWLDLDPGISTEELYDGIEAAEMEVLSLTDGRQELIGRLNDPMLQGTNGTLTLGFLVSLGVCFVGFLIYWTFSIRERTLQFGLFRAMGMSKAAIIRALAVEQLLVSGVALLAGFVVGRLMSELFAPLLQLARGAEETVPPFRVTSLPVDQLRIGAFVLLMMILGFLVLAVFLSRIRIHQAVKLGEE